MKTPVLVYSGDVNKRQRPLDGTELRLTMVEKQFGTNLANKSLDDFGQT